MAKPAQARFRIELQTVVQPTLQKAVDNTFGVEPPARQRFPKFRFSTPKSRRAFFATNGFGAGITTHRTHSLASSWVVKVSSQLSTNLITVSNNKKTKDSQNLAQFVYPGARQTPGHGDTGWGRDQQRQIIQLDRIANLAISEAWGRAVEFALGSKQ